MSIGNAPEMAAWRKFSAALPVARGVREGIQTCCGLPVGLIGSKIPARSFYRTVPYKDKDHRQLHTANIHKPPGGRAEYEQPLRISCLICQTNAGLLQIHRDNCGEAYQLWVGPECMHHWIGVAGKLWMTWLASRGRCVYTYTDLRPVAS